ncbi:MAG: hypothetical protein HY958_02185 [Bacteroidia bacterium]|nr:hypothetical protein [Bacteroidia bacterium]
MILFAIKADKEAQISYTNLPLCFLFNNEFEEAKKVYLNFKDKPYTDDREKTTFKKVFLEDIQNLEGKGITHPDFAKVKKLLNEK